MAKMVIFYENSAKISLHNFSNLKITCLLEDVNFFKQNCLNETALSNTKHNFVFKATFPISQIQHKLVQ